MKNQPLHSLEWELDGKHLLTDFFIKTYKEIPQSDLEKRIKYQMMLKKHFMEIVELCEKIESALRKKGESEILGNN